MGKGYLSPAEITDYTIKSGVTKVRRRNIEVLLMALLAGMYIAMGALTASTASHSVSNAGLAKVVAGVVFPIGLMFVVINGADLFTGNCLIYMAVLDKRIRFSEFMKNLGIVLVGNSIGAIVLAWMQANGGMFMMSDGGFGAYTIKVAAGKTNLPFGQALILAIMCNLFVCGGVWMIYGATDITGKILGSFFTVFTFVISGSEHIVANMYYIPAGIFAKSNMAFVEASGVSAAALANLSWKGLLINNAIPVTLGNIIGGMVIGAFYHTIYKGLNKKSAKIVVAKSKAS